MPKQWSSDATFHLGINMAGAVSAGAYTAGVLDFLMEALEQWYAEKAKPNSGAPMHDVCIDVFSGASAGGMCAAIASVMVQENFQHIANPADASIKGTTNRFYESWVNQIDIEPLLQSNDLAPGAPVVSLLDSTIIDRIAAYALTPGPAISRPYISGSLTLFLTLTNVRGVPFSMNGNTSGSTEEDVAYYADRLQFETVQGTNAPLSYSAKPLPIGTNGGAWPLLQDAAKATGAFPLFLAPRQITRLAGEYMNSPWLPFSATPPPTVNPHWPLKPDDPFSTLNVDGGVTNNDPFQLAHDYLAHHNPKATVDLASGALKNPRAADEANCAVLTVAPFPAQALYKDPFPFGSASSVPGMLPNLFATLISQSRFQGESLAAVMSGNVYSRFVLAPSDTDNPNQPALQCGLLSAFGGFFERGFRAHDYQLGRRNCQKFLRDSFVLSVDNPIIQAGLQNPPPAGQDWMPIIPLYGTATTEVPPPVRAKIASARLEQVLNWIVTRLHAVAKPLLAGAIGSGVGDWAARSAVDTLISTWGKTKIKEALDKELAGVIAP